MTKVEWRGPDDEALERLRTGPLLLTLQAYSDLMQMSRNSAYDAIAAGRFPLEVLKVNGRRVVRRADVLRMLLGDTAPEDPAADDEDDARPAVTTSRRRRVGVL